MIPITTPGPSPVLPQGLTDCFNADPIAFGLVVQVVKITPEMADAWLHFNHEHRKVKKSRVEKYAAKMTAGDWALTGKSIVFDMEGKLVGGQHRLAACAKSGVPFVTLVVCGVDPSVVEKEADGGDE